jgi:hypothetical protein
MKDWKEEKVKLKLIPGKWKFEAYDIIIDE